MVELKRRIVHIMTRHIGPGLTLGKKLLLGGVVAALIAIPLALGMTVISKGGTQGTGASNGRLPSFKTVSIRLNEGTACCSVYFSKDRFVATDSVMDMIMFAYGEKFPLKPVQVLGGPAWMKLEVFNIDAEPSKSLSDQVKMPLQVTGPAVDAEAPGPEVVKQAFRSLLINRFKLRVRHATKVLPVYELVLAKNGPKIAEDKTAGQSCRITDVGPDLPSVRGKERWLEVKCDFRTFAGVLSAFPELRSRVLVDKTALHGRYKFTLHWTPEMRPGKPMPATVGQSNHAAPSKPSGPSLFTALQEQLGLKVQSTTAPVDIIVIQHIENPVKK